jgi:hypothetical protein
MEETLEYLRKEAQAFMRLKPEEQETEKKKLEEQLKGINKEMTENSNSVKKEQEKLESIRAKRETIQEEYMEARERRQNAIALGESDAEIKASISNLNDERDRLRDLFIGLERRIENLNSEGNLLEEEKLALERKILRFRLYPLVPLANQKGEEWAGILKEIIVLAERLGEAFYPFRTGAKVVFPSQYEGISCIGKFYLLSDLDSPDNKRSSGQLRNIFDLDYFYESERQKREDAAKAPQQEKQ